MHVLHPYLSTLRQNSNLSYVQKGKAVMQNHNWRMSLGISKDRNHPSAQGLAEEEAIRSWWSLPIKFYE